jgi:hypothetical protein
LKHLIPMLNDTAAIMDENLLAATVILRFLEEVEGRNVISYYDSNAAFGNCPSHSFVRLYGGYCLVASEGHPRLFSCLSWTARRTSCMHRVKTRVCFLTS